MTAREASGKLAISISSGDRQKFVLAVEQAELTAVAGGEFPDRSLGFATHVKTPVAQTRTSIRS